MSVDTTLWFLAIALEAAVFVLLIRRRIARLLPIFTIYMGWGAVNDLLMYWVDRQFPAHYLQLYVLQLGLDSALQCGILIELTWAILRPARAILPRSSILIIAAVILLAGAAIWPFSGVTVLPGLTHQWRLLIRLQQTFSMLRIVFFLLVAAFSQLLAVGWRNRELQVATGLGFYSLISLGANLVQAHEALRAHYIMLDQFVRAGYFCCLLYWVASFVKKEAPRREFSPRMQQILLALAGTAHSERLALEGRKRVRK